MAEVRISDQELVAATLKDRNSFAEIVRRYEPALRRYIDRLGSSDTEATKDILQEAFIKAYINLNDFDSARSFSSWLYRIAHNEAVNQFRRQKSRPGAVASEEDLELFERIADDLDMEKEADARQRSETIRRAVSALDRRYRDVIVLRFFEEKSYDEISDILQIPGGTVATYLNRAKTELKERLKKPNMTDV